LNLCEKMRPLAPTPGGLGEIPETTASPAPRPAGP
jgi:hypothetical protein